MESLRRFLSFCSGVFILFVFAYAIACVQIIIKSIYHKVKVPWDSINPVTDIRDFSKQGTIEIVVSVALAVGLLNLIFSATFASTKIGTFYEKDNYSESYDAVLYVEDKPIFCIADISKCTDGGQAIYYINEIHFPYGKKQDIDEEYSRIHSITRCISETLVGAAT